MPKFKKQLVESWKKKSNTTFAVFLRERDLGNII